MLTLIVNKSYQVARSTTDELFAQWLAVLAVEDSLRDLVTAETSVRLWSELER